MYEGDLRTAFFPGANSRIDYERGSETRCVTLLSDLTSLHLSLYFCFLPRASPSRRITSS
jgi:hypothetical protein